MSRKYYKVGAKYGHVGRGKSLEVYIPIIAENVMHAISRAEKMGGIKKKFCHIWLVVEVTPEQFRHIRTRWHEFKLQMWAAERSSRKWRAG